jgi:hypothetical protein
MIDESTDDLILAAAKILSPLVKRLLARGIPFGRLEARLRELFVEIADAEFALPGRRQTDSRVSLLTGINRKEVRRIRSEEKTDGPRSFGMNYITSLIGRWLSDPQTTDRAGRPRPLPYQAVRGPSFMKLARKVTADIAPRILLDELVRSGAVEIGEGDVVVLNSDGYVSKRHSSEGLQILAEDPAELIETMLRNIFSEDPQPLLQRKIYYDNLGADGAKQVRAQMRREGERFLLRVNRLLAKHDRDRNPGAAGGDRYSAGIGVYFFEALEDREQREPRSRVSARGRTPNQRKRKK